MAFFALQDLRLLCKVSVRITRVIKCSDIEILASHSHNIRNTYSYNRRANISLFFQYEFFSFVLSHKVKKIRNNKDP